MPSYQHSEVIASRYTAEEKQMFDLFLKEINEVKNNGKAEDAEAVRAKFPFDTLAGLQRHMALIGFAHVMK